MIDKILQFLFGSLFVIVPLIFSPATSELFEFNKILFIYLITALVLFFWTLKMILTKKIIFRNTPLDIPIIFFLISQILSVFFSIDKHVSIFGYYGRFNGGLLSILSYIVLYYGYVANSIKTENIFRLSLITSTLVILYSLPGKLGHDLTCLIVSGGKITNNSCWSKEVNVFDPENRVFSTLGQPNWFGAYLAVNFFIGLYYLISSFVIPSIKKIHYKNKVNDLKDYKKTLLYFIYLFVNFSFILFSRSRSALVAVGFGIILFITYYLSLIKKEGKKLIITLSLITVIPILLFKTGINTVDKIISFPKSIFQNSNSSSSLNIKPNLSSSDITESLDIRKIVWEGAIKLGNNFPINGTGVETFAYSYNFVRPKSHNLTSEWDFIYNKAHNEYLNYFATTGYIGLISYLLLILSFLFYYIKSIKKSDKFEILKNILQLIAYFTILITNFFGFSTTTINLFFYLIPAFIVVANSKGKLNIEYSKKVSYSQTALVFVFSLLLIYSFYFIFSYWLADTQYARGINYLKPQISDYQKAATYFEKALKIRNESIYEDRFSSSLSYLAAIASYQKQSDLAKQLIYISDYFNQKSIKSSPKNVFYWKTRAKNQYLFYQVNLDKNYLSEGIKSLEEARRLAPTDPKIPYSLSVYYSLLFDIEKESSKKNKYMKLSILELNKALELKNNFQEGKLLKEELIKKYGQF